MPRKNIGTKADGSRKQVKKGLDENGDTTLIKELKKRDAGKVPLRIDHNTIILVLPENNNKEYAERYLQNKNITI
jgi:hypothetical protein